MIVLAGVFVPLQALDLVFDVLGLKLDPGHST